MPYIIVPIVFIALFFIYQLNKRKVKSIESKMDVNKFVVTQSRIFMWFGIAGVVTFGAFLALLSLFPNDTAEWWMYALLSALILMCLRFSLRCACWKINVDNKIFFHSFLRKDKTIDFASIDRVLIINSRNISEQASIYSNNKIALKLEPNCPGYSLFVERLRREGIAIEYSTL